MRYRDARLLANGDEVIRKTDKTVLKVDTIEAYGQYKTVKINAIDAAGNRVSLFHDEVE